jgi:hypothetical protein
VVQRTSSDLRLNPHYQSGLLDGVFAPGDDRKLEFHPLGSLSNGEVAELMQAVRIRVLGYLERQGVIEANAELSAVTLSLDSAGKQVNVTRSDGAPVTITDQGDGTYSATIPHPGNAGQVELTITIDCQPFAIRPVLFFE